MPDGADLRNQSLENERRRARNAVPKGKSTSDIDLRSFMNAIEQLGSFDEKKVVSSLSKFSNFVYSFNKSVTGFSYDQKGATAFLSSVSLIDDTLSRVKNMSDIGNIDAIVSAVSGFSSITQSLSKINFDTLSDISENEVKIATASFPTIFSNILDTYANFDKKIEEVNKTFSDLKSVQLGPTVQEFFKDFAQSLNINIDKQGNIITNGEVIGSTGAFKSFQDISSNIVDTIDNIGKMSVLSVGKAKLNISLASKLELGVSLNEFLENTVNAIVGKDNILVNIFETKTNEEFLKDKKGKSYNDKPAKLDAIEAGFVIMNNMATLINSFGDGLYKKVLSAKLSLNLATKAKFGESINTFLTQILKASDVLSTKEQREKVDATLNILGSFFGLFNGKEAPLTIYNVSKMLAVGVILTPAAITLGIGLTALIGMMNLITLVMGKGSRDKNEMVQSLSDFSKAILILSGALGLFALSALATSIVFGNIDYGNLFKGLGVFSLIILLATAVMLVDKSFGKGKESGFQQFAWSVLILSGALIVFSLGIWTMGKVIENSNIVAILAGLAIFSLFVLFAKQIGDNVSVYAKGALLIMGLAVAVGLFAVAVWLMGGAISSWGDAGSVLLGTAVLFVLSEMARRLGENWKQNLGGAAVILVLAGSYFVFAKAVEAMGKAINSWEGLGSVVVGTAILMLLGKFAQSLGSEKSFPNAMKGAIAMLVIAGSYFVFAKAVDVIGKAMDSWEDAGKIALMSALFVGLGVVAIGFGAAFKLVMLGAIAMGALAGSFLIFAVAVKTLADINYPDETMQARMFGFGKELMKMALCLVPLGIVSPLILLGSVALGAMALPLALFVKLNADGYPTPEETKNMMLFGGAIAEYGVIFAGMGLPIVQPFILAGSLALGAMTLPLIMFVGAMKVASLLDWKNIHKQMFAGDEGAFTAIVKGTLSAFKEVGLWGAVKATAGAAAIAVISASMLAFTGAMKVVGNQNWHELYKNIIGTKETKKEFGINVSENEDLTILGQIIGSVAKSFVFDGTYGLKIDVWKMQEGARAVGKVAVTLIAIGQSVRSFGNLASSLNLNGKYTLKNGPAGAELVFDDNTSIQASIYNTVMAVSTVFGFIGTQWPSGWLTKSPVAQGIESVKGVGKVLNEIADGVKQWQDIAGMGLSDSDFNFDMDDKGKITGNGIAANIGKTVMAISSVFGHIGANLKTVSPANDGLFGMVKGLIFGPETTIGKGMEAVSGVGEVLKGIADGVKTFANLGELGMSDADFVLNMDTKTGTVTGGGVMNNMAKVIMAVSSVFAQIGGSSKVYATKEVEAGGIKGLFGGKSEQKVYFSDAVEMGVKAMQGAGSEVAAMANAMKILSDMGEPKNIDISTKRITALITTVGKIYADIGGGKAGFNLDTMDKGMKAMKGAGNEVKQFADSIAVFKVGKGESIQDIETIKRSLGGMMNFTAEQLQYFGGGTVQGKLPIDLNVIVRGQKTLKEMTKGSEEMKKLFEAMKGLLSDESVSTKDLDNRITAISQVFSKSAIATIKPETIENFRSNIKSIMAEFKELGSLWSYAGDLAELDPGLQSLNSHLGSTYDLIKSPVISNMKMTDFRNLVKEIEKLGNVASPFERFEKSFKGFNDTVKKMVDNVNNIQVDKLTAFTDFNKSLIELAKQPRSQFDAVKDYVEHTMDAWFERMAEYNANNQSQIAEGFAQTNTQIQQTNKNIQNTKGTQVVQQQSDTARQIIDYLGRGTARVQIVD